MIKEIERTKRVMHKATAPHSPTSSPRPALPPLYTLGMTSYGLEHPFGQLGSPVLAAPPPSFLCPSSPLAGWA